MARLKGSIGSKAATGLKLRAAARAASTTSTCPAINFQSAQKITAGDDPSLFFGLQRVNDGSFTEQLFSVDVGAQTATLSGSIPNVQAMAINCAGLASRDRHPGVPDLKSDPLGLPARNPIIADLAGDGVGALIGASEILDPGQLIVQQINPDLSPKGKFALYPAGPQPGGFLAADFDGDGKKDVAVVYAGAPDGSSPGGVAMLLGNGDGTLRAAKQYPAGAYPVVATAFDFNGDGRPDIALGRYNGTVGILLTNADGSLRTGNDYPIADQTDIASLAAADVNGDQLADLLVLSNSTIYILYGKGDGTFQNGPSLPVAAAYGSLGAGDFNKDGLTDIAVADGAGSAYILLGKGAGNFAAPVGYWMSNIYGQFWIEDFDGDGNADLVFGAGHPDAITPIQYSPQIGVLFGNGDGTFASGAVFPVDGSKYDQQFMPTGLAIADFDGDGKLDIATSNASSKSISVGLGRGAGAFKPATTTSLDTVQPTAIATGDLNGDGKPDLVVTDGQTSVDILINNGDATFRAPVAQAVNGVNPNAVVLGDFNGDNKLDMAVANSGGKNLSILLGNGNGSFKTAVNVAVGLNPGSLVAGDFDGDGKLDLAVANGGTFKSDGTNAGSISVLLGKGDGTFLAAVNYTASDYPVFVTAGDVDGDGKLDLIVSAKGANGSDVVAVLAGTGAGTFQTAVLTPVGASPAWISAADFNGDGNLDLAVTHCCVAPNFVGTLAGNGDGTFGDEAMIAPAYNPRFATAVADFNDDSKPDLVSSSFSLGAMHTVAVLLNISTPPVEQGTLTITSAAGTPLNPPPVAPSSMVTAAGTDLATGSKFTMSLVLPTNMAGTTVAVTDSAGTTRNAQISSVTPEQVNFLVPPGTAEGDATVTITSGDGYVSVGTAAIAPVAPAVFTLDGTSNLAGYVQRVHGDGTQSFENLYTVDDSGNVSYPPIDLGPDTDQVYLNIFATGLEGRSDLSAVVITVGDESLPVLYAGPSISAGVDQVSILLPRDLIGVGTVNVGITVDGVAANTTTVNIQ